MNLILNIEIPNYIRKIEISKKRRIIYYENNGIRARKSSKSKGKQLPKKFIDENYYDYKNLKFSHLKKRYKIALVVGTTIKMIFTEHFSPLPSSYIHFAFKEDYITEKMKSKAKLLLYDIEKEALVISNPKVAGTPRNYVINGQDFYSGNLNPLVRAKIITEIKKSFVNCIKSKNLKTISNNSYPLTVVCEVHDTVKNKYDKSSSEIGTGWDIGNRAYLPYLKTMLDLLVTGKVNKTEPVLISPILKEDDRLHIRGESILFFPIKKTDTRKLIFKFYKTPFNEY